MRRSLPLLAALLLAGCSHRPSPEFRHELRTFLITADDTVKITEFFALGNATSTLSEEWKEVDAAWPNNWHEDQKENLRFTVINLAKAVGDWGHDPMFGPTEKGAQEKAKAQSLLRQAHAALDDEIRE